MHLRGRLSRTRGQTALEYLMVLIVVIIPLAALFRGLLADSKDGKHDNATRQIVNDSYGDEKRMGTIGRPYP
jgi:hypothetical protein